MAITTSQITITTMEGWYSGATPPLNPLIGDLWLDTTSNEIKKYDGTNWIKQADTQGPQGPKGDSMVSRVAYWIKSSISPEPPDPETGDMKGWIKGSEPPESALNGIQPSDKFWRIYKETYSNGESEYNKYSEVELIGSYEILNGLVQFRNGVATTENIEGQDVTVIDGGKIKSGSIDAKKIYVKDLRALDATIGGFHIGKNSIYSGVKSAIDNPTRGIYMDTDSQVYFGDDTNFIKYYKDQNGDYQLDITANTVRFGTSSTTIEEAIDNIKNESVTNLHIESSKGTVFNNNLISTVLSVIIHHGSQRITDYATMISIFGPDAHLQWKWQRVDEEDYHIISSDDSRITNNGFTFTLNAEDVDTKVTFMCELIESTENVKASGLITLSVFENIESVTRYYKLQDSSLEAPSKPTVDTLSEWSMTEPPYESSKLLYYCDITTLSTGEWIASEVSVSGIYKTLQDAYDKIDENDKLIQSWCSENDKTLINGGKIYMDKAFAESIFATKEIVATGSIKGASLSGGKIEGAYIETISGKIGPFKLSNSGLVSDKTSGIHVPYSATDPNYDTHSGYIEIGRSDPNNKWQAPIYISETSPSVCNSRLLADGLYVNGEYVYGTECITSSLITYGGAKIQGDLNVGGTLTARNVDIGIYALLGGPGPVTIIDPASDKNGEVYFGANKANSAGSTTSYLRGRNVRIYAHGDKGGVYLGSSGSHAITSDENLKNIFDIDDRYESFFNNINPVAYQYKVGHRTHLGFGARAIENALQDANLTTEEFAGILIDRDVSVGEDEIMSPDGATHFDEIYSLRYEEFIALNTYMIKKQQGIIEDLTHRIESIENTLIETKGK